MGPIRVAALHEEGRMSEEMAREKEPIVRSPEAPADTFDQDLGDAQVTAYLRRHPNFLLQNPEILRALTPPSRQRGEDVYDFQGFMINRLREDLDRLGAEHERLVVTSRDNLSGQTRVHQSVLAMLGAASFEQLVHIVTTDLAVLLDLDVVTLCVEVAEAELPRTVAGGVVTLRPGAVDELLSSGRDIVLYDLSEGDATVFHGTAELVRSSALLRLRFSRTGPVGLLALGSRHGGRFHPGQGTELLGFLARVLEYCVRAWLRLPD
jgi:hypothetical protein